MKTRIALECVFLLIASFFALYKDGLKETWLMLLIFYILIIGAEIYLYFKRRKV